MAPEPITTIVNRADIERFLHTLYGRVLPHTKAEIVEDIPPYGIEVRAFTKSGHSDQTWWVYLTGATAAIANLSGSHDVYIGVGLRKSASGGKDGVGLLTALWAEIDTEKAGMTIDAGVQILRQLSMPPSMIVFSGHGVHGYWLLKEPLDTTAPDGVRAEPLMRAITDTIDGDRKCSELARIMRVPGTLNIKADPILSTIIECNPDWRYSLDELEFRYIPRLREDREYSETRRQTERIPGTSVAGWQAFKDAVRERCDLVDLINSYHIPSPLKPNNGVYRGSMHSRDGVSLIVFADKKRGYCHNDKSPWGSKSFDCFAWVMEAERCDFKEACRILGEKYGIELPKARVHTDNIVELDELIARQTYNGNGQSGKHEKTTQPSASQPVTFNNTDLGNARRLIFHCGADVRYCHAWGKWLIWDGTRWADDETGEIQRLARQTIFDILQEAQSLPFGDDRREKLGKWAFASESRNRLESMVALAQAEPDVPIKHTELDADPWLLNVQNGILNLQTGQLLDHDRAHLCRRMATVFFDPNATCPAWLAFLHRVMDGNTEMVDFLQRAVGYSLTGLISEQCLFFLYGTGRNGKSTFIETLASLFGDYAAKTQTETLMLKREGQAGIPNDIARLPGTRFVTAAETEDGRRLNESLVKDLTGGDTITARFLHKELFEFKPQFKLWMYGNHKPNIRGTDDGIWRRVKVIPFTVTIPLGERDPDLPHKLRDELPGILAWAVLGCLKWQREGLPDTEAIQQATSAYRNEMDMLKAFLDEMCVLDKHARTPANKMYKAYLDWCAEAGEKAQSNRVFMRMLRERGFATTAGSGNQNVWLGLGLQNQS